jgi:PPOX class probable F420-dependent enzyme
MQLPESARRLITSGAHGHIITRNSDGSPQVSLVWITLDGEDVIIGHLREHQKVRNVRRNPQVALSIESPTKSAMGLAEYLVIYGTATLEEGGAPELLQRLAHIYMGPDVKFPTMENPPPGWIMRIRVDRFTGVGPWTGRVV